MSRSGQVRGGRPGNTLVPGQSETASLSNLLEAAKPDTIVRSDFSRWYGHVDGIREMCGIPRMPWWHLEVLQFASQGISFRA